MTSATNPLIRQLLDAGVHFGHQTKRWHPKMKRFLFGSRSGIYIIDLEKTAQQLQRACAFLEPLAAKGESILFVGTKKQAKQILEAEAARCAMPVVVNRWMGGTLTNFPTIKRNIDLLIQLRKQREEGYFERLSKKDAKRLARQLEKLQVNFAGLVGLSRLPACLYVVDPKREQNAVHEANRLGIPIVAICDTNADPELITHPIPGNDDAIRSIRLITALVTDSIVAGRQRAGLPAPPPAATVGGAQAGLSSPSATAGTNGSQADAVPVQPAPEGSAASS